MNQDNVWNQYEYVFVDTETTGPYPVAEELCEIAAVKWKNGEIIDQFQTLIQPSHPMGADVIKIHGITNDMVSNAPVIKDVIGDFYNFLTGCIFVAHHAPFDLGFLAIEFESEHLPLAFDQPIICSSLLARKLIKGVPNHKLQTLIPQLGIEKGAAHRALDDAKACMEVFKISVGRLNFVPTLSQLLKIQTEELTWHKYSYVELYKKEENLKIAQAIRSFADIEIIYQGGKTPGKLRKVSPKGLVRNPEGDYMSAICYETGKKKRYFLDKILEVKN